MSEPKAECSSCGGKILRRTADKNDGLCAVCHGKANAPHRAYLSAPSDLPGALDLPEDLTPLFIGESIDWKVVEDALYVIASHYVRAFAKHHGLEQFYGFAFDCNADYCQLFVCLNTKEDLHRRAEEYASRSPNPYGHLTIGQLEETLRWSLGDWKYQAFTTDRFTEAWSPVETALMNLIARSEDDSLDGFAAAFMDTTCRAMVRLERARVLEAFNRTDDFTTFVANHDESDEESWGRLKSIRNQ